MSVRRGAALSPPTLDELAHGLAYGFVERRGLVVGQRLHPHGGGSFVGPPAALLGPLLEVGAS